MSKILIGQSERKNVSLDLDVLLRTRLLIQANSGKGKSFLLRRLAEQLFGNIQVIIIDPEGEFASLREKFGYVLVGKGGETPADPRSAALVAHKLLELRASAVCDLYEMKPGARHEWVQRFLDAMVDAPKNLWHPCIVMLDEAHVYSPEKGAGESLASESVISMATRGRKRGFCLIAATQRLGKFRKDAAAEMLNVMIGGTFIDIDRKRAADALGVYGSDQHKFFDEIKLLERGSFFSLGPAISDERLLVKVGPVETSHPEAGSSKHAAEPPPAPEAIAKMLPKLADLPKEAEEKAKTVAELRTEIRSLKVQLRTQPTVAKPVVDQRTVAENTSLKHEIARVEADKKTMLVAWKSNLAALSKIAQGLRDLSERASAAIQTAGNVTIGMGQPKLQNVEAPSHFVGKVKIVVEEPAQRTDPTLSNGDLQGPHKKILKALGGLLSIGREQAPKPMVAAWAGYSPGGGAFMNPLGYLRTAGLVHYPQPGSVALTDAGRQHVGPCEPPDQDEIHRRVRDVLPGPARKILSVLLELPPGTELSKEQLAEQAGYTEGGGAFQNPLGALRTAGFVDYPRSGYVRASDWLFL